MERKTQDRRTKAQLLKEVLIARESEKYFMNKYNQQVDWTVAGTIAGFAVGIFLVYIFLIHF